MADIALDADALRRDRQRYAELLDQAEQQIVAWNERADHLQQAVDGFDHLLALADDDPARDGGVPRRQLGGRTGASPAAPRTTPGPAPGPEPPYGADDAVSGLPRGADDPVPEQPPGAGDSAPEPGADTPSPAGAAPGPASPGTVAAPPSVPAPVTPAAPEPVDPPDAEAPRGTDALRLVFESDVDRTWTLAELIAALGSRGWLPTSRRPEEGVRISLKRLAERGGAMRTDDGRWRLAGVDGPEPPEAWARAGEPPSAVAPAPVGPTAGGTIAGP